MADSIGLNMIRKLDSVEKTIRDKRETYINITERGMEVMTKQASSWTHYVDRKLKNG